MKRAFAVIIALAVLLVAAPAAATPPASTVDTVVAVSGAPDSYDKNKKDFDILRDLVVAAGLADALGSSGLTDITVLAPNDRAFQRLAKDLGYTGKYDEAAIFGFLAAGLTAYGSPGLSLVEVLDIVLKYHVIDTAHTYAELKAADSVTTLSGPLDSYKKWFIDAEGDLKNAKLKGLRDVMTYNGYIQGIDRVLIPVADLVG
jgi:uncharacterized surface protein with fasciclin (FAS1) repeats